MTRKMALAHLKVALLQGNQRLALRLYIENRISAAVFRQYRQLYFKEAA